MIRLRGLDWIGPIQWIGHLLNASPGDFDSLGSPPSCSSLPKGRKRGRVVTIDSVRCDKQISSSSGYFGSELLYGERVLERRLGLPKSIGSE